MGDRDKRLQWGTSQRSIRRRANNVLDEEMMIWTSAQPQSTAVESADNGTENDESSSEDCEDKMDYCMNEEDATCSPPSYSAFLELQPTEVCFNRDVENMVDAQTSLEEEEWYDASDFGVIRFDCDACIECKCVNCNLCSHVDDGDCKHCEHCRLDAETYFSDSENSDDESVPEQCDELTKTETEILDEFITLVLCNNFNHKQIDALLKFFRKWNVGKFPLSAKTLLNTPISYNVREVNPGVYWHRGIKKDLCDYIKETNCSEVKIKLSVDGLPLARSSGSCFWPVLCSFNDSKNVVLVGVYYGHEKPADPNEFLRDFIDETQDLCVNSVEVNGRIVRVSFSCVVCDAPAKSLVLKTKAHNAYYGCTKCTVKGKMYGRRMSYTQLNAPLRSDDSFRSQEQEEHHLEGEAKLLEFQDFGPVSCTPLEYMHLVLLGVLRKIMYFWVGGPLNVRLSKRLIDTISQSLINLSAWTPREFVRKPRSLQYIKRFKATEYRQILFYTGPVVLKNILKDELYKHFLILHTAFYILAHPKYSFVYLKYANDLLKYWVEKFKVLYGREFVSHNVHGLIHVAADVDHFGPIDKYSAFMYENFLQRLKKLIRKGEKPLSQLIRRFLEAEQRGFFQKKPEKSECADPIYSECHFTGPLVNGSYGSQYSKCTLSCALSFNARSEADNCCTMKDGTVVLIRNFVYSNDLQCMVVIGKKFIGTTDMYEYPLKSSQIGIYYVTNLHRQLSFWPVTDIEQKCYRMPHKQGFAIVPLLHNDAMTYFLVDFQDGPQIVRDTWLTEDHSICSWPPWGDDLDQITWDKEVRKDHKPQEDWTECPVLRVRLKGANFQYVRGKLKEAEDKSDTDLQSGMDNDSGGIRLRRRRDPKAETSEDSDEDLLSIQKKRLKKSNATRATRNHSNARSNIELPSFPGPIKDLSTHSSKNSGKFGKLVPLQEKAVTTQTSCNGENSTSAVAGESSDRDRQHSEVDEKKQRSSGEFCSSSGPMQLEENGPVIPPDSGPSFLTGLPSRENMEQPKASAWPWSFESETRQHTVASENSKTNSFNEGTDHYFEKRRHSDLGNRAIGKSSSNGYHTESLCNKRLVNNSEVKCSQSQKPLARSGSNSGTDLPLNPVSKGQVQSSTSKVETSFPGCRVEAFANNQTANNQVKSKPGNRDEELSPANKDHSLNPLDEGSSSRNVKNLVVTNSEGTPNMSQPTNSQLEQSSLNQKDKALALAKSMTELEFRAYVISALSSLKAANCASIPRKKKTSDQEPSLPELDILFGMPADSMSEWNDFDDKLSKASPEVIQDLKHTLRHVGGVDAPAMIRSILGKLLSNRLGGMFSYHGAGIKAPFKETYFVKFILFKVVKQQFKKYSDLDTIKVVENWLRLSNQRKGGLSFSSKKQSSRSHRSGMGSTPTRSSPRKLGRVDYSNRKKHTASGVISGWKSTPRHSKIPVLQTTPLLHRSSSSKKFRSSLRNGSTSKYSNGELHDGSPSKRENSWLLFSKSEKHEDDTGSDSDCIDMGLENASNDEAEYTRDEATGSESDIQY